MEERLLALGLAGEVDVGRGQRRAFQGEARLGRSGRRGLWKEGGRARRRAADREVGAATTVPRGTALEAVRRQSGLALREVGRRGACQLEG